MTDSKTLETIGLGGNESRHVLTIITAPAKGEYETGPGSLRASLSGSLEGRGGLPPSKESIEGRNVVICSSSSANTKLATQGAIHLDTSLSSMFIGDAVLYQQSAYAT